MTCYAALDIGSNSVRLLVGKVQGTSVQPLRTALRSTRLLAGAVNGWLQEEAVQRTVTAVAELAALARDYQPRDVVCVATSAAREARNPELLRAGVSDDAGLDLIIIDGHTEARLAYQGALAGFKEPVANPLVIDIGGGSTELSWQDEDRLQLVSVKVGAVRATETAMSRVAMETMLAPVLARARKVRPGQIIGTGGTITTVAALELGLEHYQPELVHGMLLTTEQVQSWRRRLAVMPLAERRKLPGLQPERADIIVAGVTILEIILAGLVARDVVVSEADLLWGLLLARARGEKLGKYDIPGPAGGSHYATHGLLLPPQDR
ncbi:Ppx/GppA phosphatase [Moorella sp. E308F]|jgi:exopolyphosphatase/guanosine-5'-triphosphate,3'-diphosphate pyrophosphatase|uniref:Ppx/GppA phosphatase family protein n=1 Tax=unclassified Neomoorella TaxID=2676739 RepID=UPI0010FFC3D6|nr:MULTISPECIES: Ppx/GppA family phosphatase [unclassified Moorella (in: firmicutes)]MDK2894519.1 exopolyphosphatase / guanosine-5-triphosphate,3-diphosphate pyrophosphatase [Moorella sp. (in: firmicutes)]GEA14566.1 Ppx/GppA phosphatase [Moorella sp. E308F]GEA18063.1 Ppx/GppA phosphatase [Moorella sp. E306M]